MPQRIHSGVNCREETVTSSPADCGRLAADIAVWPPQRCRSCGNHSQGCVSGRAEQPGEGTVAAVWHCCLAFTCMQEWARLSMSRLEESRRAILTPKDSLTLGPLYAHTRCPTPCCCPCQGTNIFKCLDAQPHLQESRNQPLLLQLHEQIQT